MSGIVILGAGPQSQDGGNNKLHAKGEGLTSAELFDVTNLWWRTAHPNEGVILYAPKDIINDRTKTFHGCFDMEAKGEWKSGGKGIFQPAKVIKLFEDLKKIDLAGSIVEEKMAELIADTHVAKRFKGLNTTTIYNPYNKRFDYSNMQKFLGHAMKYYTAAKTLNYLKETERARSEAIQSWNGNNDAYQNSGVTERNRKWTQHYKDQFETTGGKTTYSLKPGCSNYNDLSCYNQHYTPNGLYNHALSKPWKTASDPASLTGLQNLASRTLWLNEPTVKGQLGEFDPNSNFRMIAWGDGLNNYAETLNDPANGFVSESGVPNWVSLNPANSHWDAGNFRDPAKNPGMKPGNLSFAKEKKFLKGMLILGACLAGIGVISRMISSITNDPNSSYAKNGFKASSVYSSNTSRLLAHSTGQTLLVTWFKNLLQEHDPTHFMKDAYTGAKEYGGKLGKYLKGVFGTAKSNATGQTLKDDYKLIHIEKPNGDNADTIGRWLSLPHTVKFLVLQSNYVSGRNKNKRVAPVAEAYFLKKYPNGHTVTNWRARIIKAAKAGVFSEAAKEAEVTPRKKTGTSAEFTHFEMRLRLRRARICPQNLRILKLKKAVRVIRRG